MNLEDVYERAFRYADMRGFEGHDPFDGLESRIFRSTPLHRFRTARFAAQQIVKRSPVDLRRVLRVPAGQNAKGIALFLLASLSRFRATGERSHMERIDKLNAALRALEIRGETATGATASFGYNFDWQSRVFYAPKGTPTIVPTAFAARALIEGFEAFGRKADLEAARRICRFILSDLGRPHDTDDEVCFSYTPNDNNCIYNASLLAGETLAAVGAIDENVEYLALAARCAKYVIRRQRVDGGWTYGPGEKHQWIDNFHTAFVLDSLARISERVPGVRAEAKFALTLGLTYWMGNFFAHDGAPKYFDSETYPIDIHSAAAAIAVLADLRAHDPAALPLAEKVAAWTIDNMFDSDGHFYYQVRRGRTIRTAYMRWGQAWMSYAIAKLLEAKQPAS